MFYDSLVCYNGSKSGFLLYNTGKDRNGGLG